MTKKLLPIDNGNFCGTLGLGYSNKKEFCRDYKKETGEPISREDYRDLQLVKVIIYEKNGEPFYDWSGKKCPCCGAKNSGILSILDIH